MNMGSVSPQPWEIDAKWFASLENVVECACAIPPRTQLIFELLRVIAKQQLLERQSTTEFECCSVGVDRTEPSSCPLCDLK